MNARPQNENEINVTYVVPYPTQGMKHISLESV